MPGKPSKPITRKGVLGVQSKRATKYPELTAKQLRFTNLYYESGNATDAYRRTYDTSAYQPANVNVVACNLVKNIKVQARLRQLEAIARRAADVTPQRIAAELAKLAFVNVKFAYQSNGELQLVPKMDDDITAAIAGVEQEEIYEWKNGKRVKVGNLRKVKFHDKLGALDKLAKITGMYVESDSKTAAASTSAAAVTLEAFRQMMEKARVGQLEPPTVDAEPEV